MTIAPDPTPRDKQRRCHLPILDEHGGVVGIVSQRDLFLSGLVRAVGFGTSATEKVLESLQYLPRAWCPSRSEGCERNDKDE